ncbi:MAG: hypothetical protein E7449_06475 [Ruminococcaceae bacterium]|nr:hypothetical protein [Oscillospiraceae bacterium]
MKRRFFVTILLLFALLSLAACAEKTPTAVPEEPKSQPTEPEADVLSIDLPEWISSADHIEMLHHCCTSSFRRVLPQEHIETLLRDLPQWVGEPMDAADAVVYDGSDGFQLNLYLDNALRGMISFKLQEGWLAVYTPSDEQAAQQGPDAFYRIEPSENLDLQALFDLCTPRPTVPKPVSVQVTSPEGQTKELLPAQAAALANAINGALDQAEDAYLPYLDEHMRQSYWLVHITAEDGAEMEIWLDCCVPVSSKSPFSRYVDFLGAAAFILPREQMDTLKELLQSYME